MLFKALLTLAGVAGRLLRPPYEIVEYPDGLGYYLARKN